MERWIFTQAVYGGNYYKIPVGINYVDFTEVERSNRKQWNKAHGRIIIPYREILFNLVGKEFEKYLTPT